MTRQLMLDVETPQPRGTWRENRDVHRAIVALRLRGHRIYRAQMTGAGGHRVDGQRMTTNELMRLARRVGAI